MIVPIALRINIHIVDMSNNQEAQNAFYKTEFNADRVEFKLRIDDGLDLHDKTIFVLRKSGYYDIIYKNKDQDDLNKRMQWDQPFRDMFSKLAPIYDNREGH